MQFHVATLGCPKNEVISDYVAQLLVGVGHTIVADPLQADWLIVNTCGFIESAREESLDVLREFVAGKRAGQKLIALGCLPELVGECLRDEVPGVDGVLGTRRWMEITELIARVSAADEAIPRAVPVLLGEPPAGTSLSPFGRVLRGHTDAMAYLCVSDGCNAPCAFCAIPQIKGALRSRPVADVVDEARCLVARGAKELVLIAQDTTAYGSDRGEKDALPGLLREVLRAVPDLSWLRLMYAYPQHISADLIAIMAQEPRICHYLDLPLQHAHPDTLRRMRRPHDTERVLRILSDLRQAMPDIALRTSLIVGYPGETEEEFATLLHFVREVAFDRVGVFTYSREAGTPAYDLPDQLPKSVKQARYDQVMTLQQQVSLQRNEAQIGRTLDVLVEGTGDGISVGRSYRDAPEIDGLVVFGGEAPIGRFASVRITQAEIYDLAGTWVDGEPRPKKKNRR